MKCHRHQTRLASLAAGELSPVRTYLLNRHLRRCMQCGSAWQQTQNLWSNLRPGAEESVSDALRSRVLDGLARITLEKPRRVDHLKAWAAHHPRLATAGVLASVACVLAL